MMAISPAYQDLNPFISTSIGETDLWKNGLWADVPTIHASQFESLMETVKLTRRHKRTQVRFIRGAGGSGKSHLFTRLRRELADSIFYAYAANPPRQPEALESFFLNRLVGSLRHPGRARDGSAMPYSQLRHLAYALLRPVVEQEVTLDQLHEAWVQIPLDEQKSMTHQALLLLEEEHPMVPRSILRCVLSTLRSDKEHLAAQWLSGATYLTEADLKYLGVPDSLKLEDAGAVLHLLGKLAAQAGLPFVLVMDQLDLFTKPEDLDEFQRLLFGLIDQSTNWVVFIGLISDRFVTWDSALTQALRGRIGVPDTRAPLGFRLPVIDVLPIGPADKRLLIEARLNTPELAEQREKDGIPSALHPLTSQDLDELVSGGAIFPRHLLAGASELYDARVAGKREPAQETPPRPAESTVVKTEPEAEATSPPIVTPPKTPSPPPAPAPAGPPVVPVVTAAAATAATVAAASVPVTAPRAPTAPPTVAVPKPVPNPLSSPSPFVVPSPASASTPTPTPTPPSAVSKAPLKEKLSELLAKAIGAAKTEAATPSAIELGERVRELIELLADSKVVHRPGDLKDSYSAFDGSDQVFTWSGATLRVVATDAMRNSFIATLERLQAMKGPLLLLRHAVAGISGVRTVELVNDVKRRHHFHHVPGSEADVLAGLGRVLAALREGSYETLATEPSATAANVHAALRELPVLKNLTLWEMIIKAHDAKPAIMAPPSAPNAVAPVSGPKGMLATLAAQTAKLSKPSPQSQLPPPTFVEIPSPPQSSSAAAEDDVPVAKVANDEPAKIAPSPAPLPTPAKFPVAPNAARIGTPVTKQVTPPPIPVARKMPPPLPPRKSS